MDKTTFSKEKEKLENYAKEQLVKPGRTKLDVENLTMLIGYLDGYTYENRLEMKGLMAHSIIDSLYFDDHSLATRFILFDNAII